MESERAKTSHVLSGTAGRFARRIAPIAGVLSLALAAPAGAATFDVNDDTTGPGPAGANCAGADFTSIDDAVAQAAVTGDGINDLIRVCAGTYDELVSIAANDGLDLLGPQQGVDARTRSVPAGEEAVITDDGSGDGSIEIDSDNVLVDGFLIEGEGTNAPAGGINVGGGSGHQLINNVIRDNVLGIHLCNASGNPALVRHNLIEDNNDPGPMTGNGIVATCGIDDAVIDENRFSGHANHAASITGSSSENVDFTENELDDEAGVFVDRATDMTIEDNTVADATTTIVDVNGGVDDIEVTGNTFTGGDLTSVRIANGGVGGPNSNVVVTGNTLLGDPVETTDRALFVAAGGLSNDLEAHFNRIAGNSTGAENDDVQDSIDAENNWWGCSEGPAMSGCDNVIGDVDFDPWLVLGITASPTSIQAGSGSSQISASLTRNSTGAVIGPGFPDQTSIGFSTSLGSIGSSALTTGAVATASLSAPTPGTAIVSGHLDSESAVTAVAITEPPAAAPPATRKKCKKKKKKKCKKKANARKHKRLG